MYETDEIVLVPICKVSFFKLKILRNNFSKRKITYSTGSRPITFCSVCLLNVNLHINCW